ncbi:nucleotidyl transferase AbiEii/AbiGii toxin family protein [Nocardia bhagyanarayanae]|uniref:Nucleotidyltransferase AbiEii toxin of type IV toxin-antitoxin system n=1 Tax=Nocardia bhagyanarayanae TaxID=1215925 RepID=A0A543FFD8_9NOCA|nr:nucleotidyl transferase AbiEii/AbiGii toxin family protein [Nocardia bhagyanarayanae]TQM32482.1 nucleotidyltransferase AbiEii toxin of type IV toxin-antitoxin system [Nocardia bhagyanarayanae]
MTTEADRSWKELGIGGWSADAVVPHDPPTEQIRTWIGLPPTLRPVRADGVRQTPVFDPAAKSHFAAMRLTDPRFDDPEVAAAWFAARRAALDTVLAAIAASPWARDLMLNGSALLRAWLGERAREPGDLDFVVLPRDWEFNSDRTDQLLTDVATRVAAATEAPDSPIRARAEDAVEDDIWTYDRVPGRRLVLPWSATRSGIPGGTVQLDFVFDDALPQSPQWTEIPRLGTPGPPGTLLAATPDLALAWKLLWVYTDAFPQGKDLYDAVLLAEHRTPDAELLHTVVPNLSLCSLFERGTCTEWDEFAKDRPDLAGREEAFAWRLVIALDPAVTAGFGDWRKRWSESIRSTAKTITDRASDPASFDDELACHPWHSTMYQLLVLQEKHDCSLIEAADRLAAARRRSCDPTTTTRIDPRAIAETLQGWRRSEAPEPNDATP